jgi:rhodanese-related sulfurtransferase
MINREKFSAILLVTGLIMAFLPFPKGRSFTEKPDSLLGKSRNETTFFSVDEVAGFVIREDSTVQLIDVRDAGEFRNFNIPGSVNIPLSQIPAKEWEGLLGRENIRNIFYSNGNTESNYAWVVATGLGYKNCSVMKGGMNEWYTTIMNSKFSGETISPRENFLFETRTRARDLFISINTLPDSLKVKFMNAKKVARKKLDGGCE